MVAPRRQPAIGSLVIWALACAACGGAAAPRVAAPVAPPSQAASGSPSSAERSPGDGEQTRVVETEAPPIVASPATPVAATATPPAIAPPPCPGDARDSRQKPEHVLQLMQLSDAMTVVDIGSGSGYFLCWLSRGVGARGRVVATEIDSALIRDLKRRVEREHLGNVDVIRAPSNDVGISPGVADRILLVNVWHHLPDRKRYATRIARALAPGGKLVVIDFKPGRSAGHGIQPERIIAELAAGGLDAALVADELAEQYVIVASARSAT